MANAGGINLKEEIAKIRQNNIKIDPLVWDTLYLYIGDYLSAINLSCARYIKRNEPINIKDSQRILSYARKIHEILQKLLHHEKIKEENQRLEKIKNNNMVMAPEIQNLINHFVNNDLHRICMAIESSLDPVDMQPVSVEYAKIIYDSSSSMTSVLEELRKATQKDVGF